MTDARRDDDRPVVVLAMFGALAPALLDEVMPRLTALADVPDPAPLERFDEPRAEALLGRADVLLTGWACPPIDDSVLQRSPRLGLIAHAAGTVKDHITPAVWERGVRVSSAAAANAVPVAEFTLAAMLFANKQVFAAHERYRRKRIDLMLPLDAGNRGKTMGIVGASRVGRLVIELLAPFELDVVVYDPTITDDDARAMGAERVELDELLARSDVVSLHVPAVPATTNMIDRRALALMRDGATLVNTARGAVVDHDALIAELGTRRINAVLDVTLPEPLPADSPLFDMPNVFLTPHIAGAAGTEIPRLAELAVDEIERWAKGDPLEHEVLAEQWDRIA
jgi:phosphoglycerate dehydrogenase-like enzyme